MLDFDREQNCYGCGACAYVCPRNAIDMIQNTEGFLMPEVDERVCIGCGLCEKNCTFMNPYTPDRKLEASTCYAGFHKNREKLKESTSGGIAATLIFEYRRVCSGLQMDGRPECRAYVHG